MKKTAALLLLGFVTATTLHAQEKLPGSAVPSNGQVDVRKAKTRDDFVTLNFTNIDISALVKVMSELLGKNFLLDERLNGKVTIMTPKKISPMEAYQVFLSALELKGFTAVEDDQVTRIIPTSAARQSGLKVFKDGDFAGHGFVTKLIRLEYANPNDMVRTLMPLVSRDGSMIANMGSNSLIVTDSVHNLKKIESLIAALDIPAPEGRGRINVYYLKHANSEDFAKVMAALVSRLPAAPPGGAPAAAASAPATILEGQVTISSEKATNSLIIVASPSDYETIKDVIQKLDIRRRQVYVEAAIIEMSLSKQRELGFEFQASNTNLENNKLSGIGGTNYGNIGNAIVNGPAAFANLSGLTVGAVKGTFTFRGQEFLNVGALLRALQTDGDVNVLSTPNILTMDNQKAEIMVGQNVPFPTGQSQSAVTGGNLQTLIERRDVGIKLSLTPQITSDDNVRLDVNQEISDVTDLNPQLGPTTNKRSAITTVVVKDRETMVIGGLIRDNVVTSTSKVPLLGDIPLLGWFFKSKTTRVEKTNLMIFITPYIIKNEGDAADITQRKNEVLENFREEYRIERKATAPVVTPRSAPEVEKPSEEKISPEVNGNGDGIQTAPAGTDEAGEPAPMITVPEIDSAPSDTGSIAPPEAPR